VTRKSITTSHTVVSCDVCGRRLLRGERSETFIAGGSRRVVCELCTPRAAHEGWLREGLDDIGVRRNGGGRSRSLIGKLKSRREAYLSRNDTEPEKEPMAHERYERSHRQRTEAATASGAHAAGGGGSARDVHAVPTNAELKLARAVEVFNASQHTRTIAGVARSLGDPFVAVRPSPTEGAVVQIVAGWELTWYRFEVDLGNEAAGVRITDQGSELAELDDADRVANATFQEGGTVALVS
jgi:hypothetical protein